MKKFIIALVYCLLVISCSKDIEPIDNTRSVFGVISDLETGNPISNVSVSLYEGLAWNSLGASVGSTFTGTDGFFQINVDKKTYESYFIVFRHSGYEPVGQRVKIDAGKKTEINNTMTKKTN